MTNVLTNFIIIIKKDVPRETTHMSASQNTQICITLSPRQKSNK